MTSRDRLFALSFHKMDWYHTAIKIIRLFICIFTNITIEGNWKVTLTHMIMYLEAILEIQEELLQTESLDFLCLARFNQDCIENEFSNIRIQRPKPSALECKTRLKQLALSRKAVSISNSSYNFDGSSTLIDLMSRKKIPKETDTISSDVFLQLHEMESLTDEEEEILYKMCGYVVFKLKQRIKCTNCYSKLLYSGPGLHPRSGFLKCCEFVEGALVSVSDEVFQLLKAAELIIRNVKDKIKDVGQMLRTKIEHYLKRELSTFIISTCHDTKDILISRYCSMRLCQIASELSNMTANKNNTSAFGSKSMGSRLLADNFNPINCNRNILTIFDIITIPATQIQKSV